MTRDVLEAKRAAGPQPVRIVDGIKRGECLPTAEEIKLVEQCLDNNPRWRED